MRHAVYWLPDEHHPLWRAGCDWLGRDPASAAWTAPPPRRTEPWRYGFHATLKAPIRLRSGCSADDWLDAVRGLAATLKPFTLPALRVDELDGFVALRPHAPCPAMNHLADRCVEALDTWRAPMPPEEFERRRAGLDDEQLALLGRWGYPHVFSRWRLHLTLTDRIAAADERAAWRRQAADFFEAALREPLRVDAIACLEQVHAEAPFRLAARVPLAAVS